MATIDKYLKVRKGVDTPDVLTSSATVYDYLKTPLVYFDTTASALPAVGGVVWDDGEGTLSLGLKGGNVNLQIGQENIALCYNGTASAISAGNVVYISGAQGQRPSISLATSTTEQGSSKVFGIVAESIASGAEGFVATFGVVPGINTEGITEGAALWLSASAGKFTETKPTSPNHLVFIGYCLKANASSGRIFVNPQNGYELEELHDVLITSASNNHIISYNAASGLWVNKNLLNAVKEVDGAGSGIDADLLDGLDSTYFLPTSASSLFGNANVYMQDEAPVNPDNGDIWVDTDSDISLVWAKVIFDTEEPENPENGLLWIDSDSDVDTLDLTNYALLDSPAFTGVPTAPTASVGTNSTQIATTAFVYSMLSGIDGGTPSSTYEFTIDGGSA